ncbi:MAG: MerR family transcriptional regulator [Firmicutes bacterium]|nr:MerR family transcriptional regulator [Bacillota bacterium]
MDQKQLYSSGQASKICDVTRRALRLYEAKGLIVPDHISEGGYRYFTMETLRRVQVIRYFLEEGFSLEMAGKLLSTNDLGDYEEFFQTQIRETEEKITYYQNRLDSLKGWYDLLCEGRRVRMIGQDNVTLKHIPTRSYMCMKGVLDADDPYGEAQLETLHYTMAKSDGHSLIDVGGAYTLYSGDFQNRIDGVTSEITLIQESYPGAKSSKNNRKIDGFLAVSAYHLGRLSEIGETYRRAVEWAGKRDLILTGESYERYVIDIYTSDNQDEYVTEILLPVECDQEEFNYLCSGE